MFPHHPIYPVRAVGSKELGGMGQLELGREA
jgi:hypothetical protein